MAVTLRYLTTAITLTTGLPVTGAPVVTAGPVGLGLAVAARP
jgi:hypothetical protein